MLSDSDGMSLELISKYIDRQTDSSCKRSHPLQTSPPLSIRDKLSLPLTASASSASFLRKVFGEHSLKAIRQMRSDPSLLGGEDELRIALCMSTWSINQGCYLCQGMMAYQSPKP